MNNERFFDQALKLIEAGGCSVAVPMLAGNLHSARVEPMRWEQICRTLRSHPLHKVLLEDPYVGRCFERPRGYAGDAPLIDLIYDRQPPAGTSIQAAEIFSITIGFPVSQAVRLRRDYAADMLKSALASNKRICSLACGHFREADGLVGRDMKSVVVVDQDVESLDVVRLRHGPQITTVEANVMRYLRAAGSRGETFDLVYTLGLTDYLDDRAMLLLHRMVKPLLRPGGRFLLANFKPHHLAMGWMEAVMDWHLIYRDEEDLAAFAEHSGMTSRTWTDPTGSIAWCEMEAG